MIELHDEYINGLSMYFAIALGFYGALCIIALIEKITDLQLLSDFFKEGIRTIYVINIIAFGWMGLFDFSTYQAFFASSVLVAMSVIIVHSVRNK